MEFWCLLENQTIELIRTSIIFFYVFDSSYFFMYLIHHIFYGFDRCSFKMWICCNALLDVPKINLGF